MAKQRAQEAHQQPPTPAPAGVHLTHPLFGIAQVPGTDKYMAVRFSDGAAVSLTPKRAGKDAGEAIHFAVARAHDAFKAACLGNRA